MSKTHAAKAAEERCAHEIDFPLELPVRQGSGRLVYYQPYQAAPQLTLHSCQLSTTRRHSPPLNVLKVGKVAWA